MALPAAAAACTFLYAAIAKPALYFCVKVRGSVCGCTVAASPAATPIAASSWYVHDSIGESDIISKQCKNR